MRAERTRARVGSWLAVVTGIAAALAPKCPLCLAAYLSIVGVNVAAARVLAPLFLPVGLVLAGLGLAALVALRLARAPTRWLGGSVRGTPGGARRVRGDETRHGGPVAVVRGKHAVVAGEVHPWGRNQRGEAA